MSNLSLRRGRRQSLVLIGADGGELARVVVAAIEAGRVTLRVEAGELVTVARGEVAAGWRPRAVVGAVVGGMERASKNTVGEGSCLADGYFKEKSPNVIIPEEKPQEQRSA
ncbi:MAG TPA: hypothetical protein VH253_06285 [Phycisphaerae bacterium]|nr:hypothetical protein [Phycisphaerae bacterium]